MKRSLPIILALGACATLAAFAQEPPSVETRFENPRRFTDFRTDRFRSARDTERLMQELRAWMAAEAPRHLPQGTRLTVTITDVDMAGEYEFWRTTGGADIRVIREAYPSRVNLAFSLSDGSGNVVREGERKLVSTLLYRDSLRVDDGPLSFEKTLLRSWLAREFGARAQSPAAR